MFIDTHVFAWITSEPERLTPRARISVERATGLCMSTTSLYEIGQKVRLGKWPAMAPMVRVLDAAAEDIGITLVPVDSAVALMAAGFDWPHRDPFDRFIAASAMALDLPLVSADPVFDSLPLKRIW